MWVTFVCLCGKYNTANGHRVCLKCGRRMVVSFQRKLAAEKCGHAFRFVPDEQGVNEIRHLHSGTTIRGTWLPMAEAEHREHADRRRRPTR
jgi:hypothetical protein